MTAQDAHHAVAGYMKSCELIGRLGPCSIGQLAVPWRLQSEVLYFFIIIY